MGADAYARTVIGVAIKKADLSYIVEAARDCGCAAPKDSKFCMECGAELNKVVPKKCYLQVKGGDIFDYLENNDMKHQEYYDSDKIYIGASFDLCKPYTFEDVSSIFKKVSEKMLFLHKETGSGIFLASVCLYCFLEWS